MAGYIVLGIGFGILMADSGMGLVWSFLMGALIYAGSMQFVAVGLISSCSSFLTIAVTTLMVNARHLFYGISMIEKYRDTKPYKPYLIFALTDETYSLCCDDNTMDKVDYFEVSLFDQIYWVSGCVLGSLIGNIIPFDLTGIDFALTALFVSIFVNQWIHAKDHIPAVYGVMVSLLCLVFFGKDSFLIPSMIGIIIALALPRRIKKEGE